MGHLGFEPELSSFRSWVRLTCKQQPILFNIAEKKLIQRRVGSPQDFRECWDVGMRPKSQEQSLKPRCRAAPMRKPPSCPHHWPLTVSGARCGKPVLNFDMSRQLQVSITFLKFCINQIYGASYSPMSFRFPPMQKVALISDQWVNRVTALVEMVLYDKISIRN